ncbi:hypothetical protein EHS25_001895 [Saitozyma podzolica]|uniref:Uncharacterized protein n=1 Tax=Saitozyma podzolica TaxID=1890683 RepID=A0A427YFF5_9TREE|nr:hypothetical protein EHS25_001895 [Saitozyma podzolica]
MIGFQSLRAWTVAAYRAAYDQYAEGSFESTRRDAVISFFLKRAYRRLGSSVELRRVSRRGVMLNSGSAVSLERLSTSQLGPAAGPDHTHPVPKLEDYAARPLHPDEQVSVAIHRRVQGSRQVDIEPNAICTTSQSRRFAILGVPFDFGSETDLALAGRCVNPTEPLSFPALAKSNSLDLPIWPSR